MFDIFYGGRSRPNRNGNTRGRFGLITRKCACNLQNPDGSYQYTEPVPCTGLGAVFSIFDGPGTGLNESCTSICENCLGVGATGYFIDTPQRRRTRR